ncbi:synaptic plasticity regulator PANTS [Onthophagus taurus]|uniref:synaptic plasticity regulator PANTS n=1 Tax=Onthophagus taurus TaxID=166361 RepID=UPI0039BE2763
MSNVNEAENKSKEFLDGEWMIRSCDVYEDEYSDCTSLKARFNQYFIFGEYIDCSQWKRDADNCVRWKEKQDVKSAKELIESERIRRLQRLKGHYSNNVWTKRTEPPKDWDKPLPNYLQKEYEHTYLNIKAKEMKGELPPSFDASTNCAIL